MQYLYKNNHLLCERWWEVFEWLVCHQNSHHRGTCTYRSARRRLYSLVTLSLGIGHEAAEPTQSAKQAVDVLHLKRPFLPVNMEAAIEAKEPFAIAQNELGVGEQDEFPLLVSTGEAWNMLFQNDPPGRIST